jgi:hypothetical protein
VNWLFARVGRLGCEVTAKFGEDEVKSASSSFLHGLAFRPTTTATSERDLSIVYHFSSQITFCFPSARTTTNTAHVQPRSYSTAS